MSSNVQIIDEDEQHSLKYRQPSSSNKGYFTFKNGRKTEEGIENNSSLGEMGRSVCNVAGCGFTVEGKETRILLNHLKKHQIEYAKFLSKCKEKVGKVGSVHHSVNTVKTAIKDQPTVEKVRLGLQWLSLQLNQPHIFRSIFRKFWQIQFHK